MAEESTTVTPQNTVTRAVEAARSPKTSLKFPNNLGETGSELHSYTGNCGLKFLTTSLLIT